jgi:hypothetical protein
MKRLFFAVLIASALSVPAALGQESGSAAPQKDAAQTATQATDKLDKQKAKSGTDCSQNRAGGRCNKPKPRKPWFFGKA